MSRPSMSSAPLSAVLPAVVLLILLGFPVARAQSPEDPLAETLESGPALDVELLDRICPPDDDVLYCLLDQRQRSMPDRDRLRQVRASDDASFSVRPIDGIAGAELDARSSSPGMRWSFAAPKGQAIGIGVYEGAERTSFRGDGLAGSDLAIDGSGCSHSATFELVDLRFDEQGKLAAVGADFHQRCGPSSPGVRGRVCWNCRSGLFDRWREPPLELTVSDPQGLAPLQGERRHRVEILNRGRSDVSGLRLVAEMSPNVVPAESFSTVGACASESITGQVGAAGRPAEGRAAGNRIVCELGTLAAGASFEAQLALKYGKAGSFEPRILLVADAPETLPRSNRRILKTTVLSATELPRLFALGPGTGPSWLHALDPMNGEATAIGETGLGFSGCSALAFGGPDQLFGVCRSSGEAESGEGEDAATVLVAIDLDRGVGRGIGPLGIESAGESAIDDMARHEGRLVAISQPQDLLWTIDPATGAATLVGTYQGLNDDSHGLAAIDEQLYELGETALEAPVRAGWSQTISTRAYGQGVRALAGIPGDRRGLFALIEEDPLVLARVKVDDGQPIRLGTTDPDLVALAVRPPAGTALEGAPSGSTAGPAAGTAADGDDPIASLPEPSGPGTLVGTMSATVDVLSAQIRYRITVENRAGHAQKDNPGDEVVLQPPPGVRLFPGPLPTRGSVVHHVQAGVLGWNGALEPGQAVVIEAFGAIGDLRAGTEIRAQAILRYDGDGDGLNESVGLSDDPSAPGDRDPTTWSVPSTAVLVGWALAGLVVPLVLLAAIAAWVRRRRP